MIRLSSLRSRPRPSWAWWLLMCCGLCPCYRSTILYGTVDAANATSSSMLDGAIQLEQMSDGDEEDDFFEVGGLTPYEGEGAGEDDTHPHPPAPASTIDDVSEPSADAVRGLLTAIGAGQEVPGRVTATSVTLPLVPLGSRGLSMLSQALFSHPSLQVLELISNNVGGTASLLELSQLLTLTRSLTSLTLAHNELSDTGVRQLGAGLRENASLRSLNLSHNAITDGGMQSLCSALADNRGLERLDVSGNLSVGDLSVDALLDAERKRRRRRKREDKEKERHAANTSSTSSPSPLPSSPPPAPSSQRSLTHLTIASNSLSPHCAASLLELLSLSSLVHLDVSHCLLDDSAAELLVEEAVDRSRQLRTLRLEGNHVGDRTRKRVEGWRKWVAGMDEVEEKKREEGREIVLDEPKVERKVPKVNGARSRPRSERNSGRVEEVGKRTGRGEEDERKEERMKQRQQTVGGTADEKEGMVEVVVEGSDGGPEEVSVPLSAPATRPVDPAPPDASFTIDDEPTSDEDDPEHSISIP